MVLRVVLSLILLTFAMNYCSAQQDSPSETSKQANDNPSWLPKVIPTINFSALSYARLTPNQQTIQIVKPEVTTENRTRSVPITTYNTETRQRTVKVDGKDEIQNYTVTIPVTTMVDQTSVVTLPPKVQKLDLPVEKVRAWELSGKELSADELRKRISKPTQLFVLRLKAKELEDYTFQPVEPFFGGVIKLDTIVIYYPFEESKPAASPKP